MKDKKDKKRERKKNDDSDKGSGGERKDETESPGEAYIRCKGISGISSLMEWRFSNLDSGLGIPLGLSEFARQVGLRVISSPLPDSRDSELSLYLNLPDCLVGL